MDTQGSTKRPMDPVVYCAQGAHPGRFLTVDAPAVSAADLGLLVGLGLFETLRAIDGRLPLWERHMARLRASTTVLGIPCPTLEACAAWRAIAEQVLAQNGRQDGVLRITLTAGSKSPTLLVSSRERLHSAPVRLHPVRSVRRGPRDPTAAVKTTSRAFYEIAHQEALAAGADDGVILGLDQVVLETCIGNLLWRVGGRYYTPLPDGRLLPGIGNAVLSEGLAALDGPVLFMQATLDQVRASDAVFVTNAVHGARPAMLEGGPKPQGDVTLDRLFAAVLAR